MSTLAPERPQAIEALEEANRLRLGMAAHRRTLSAMSPQESIRAAADLLEEPDEFVARMRVGYLLCSIERVGIRRARRILREACGSPAPATERRVGPFPPPERVIPQLTERQRQAIIARLRELAPRRI